MCYIFNLPYEWKAWLIFIITEIGTVIHIIWDSSKIIIIRSLYSILVICLSRSSVSHQRDISHSRYAYPGPLSLTNVISHTRGTPIPVLCLSPALYLTLVIRLSQSSVSHQRYLYLLASPSQGLQRGSRIDTPATGVSYNSPPVYPLGL